MGGFKYTKAVPLRKKAEQPLPNNIATNVS